MKVFTTQHRLKNFLGIRRWAGDQSYEMGSSLSGESGGDLTEFLLTI